MLFYRKKQKRRTKLDNKTIVIIGASGDLGQAIIGELHKNNRLIVTSRRYQNDSLNESFSKQQLDVTDKNSIHDFFNRLESSNIKIDGLIFNSGINEFELLTNIEDNTIHNILSTNLEGCILINKKTLPLLNEDGFICNIGSVLGNIPFPGYSVYSATKAGIKAFSQALNRELINKKQCVLYFEPRAMNTKMNSEKAIAFNQVMGSTVDSPEDVARLLTKHIQRKKSGIPFKAERFFSIINALFPKVIDKNILKNASKIFNILK
jgi:short-subunit dehydrogenase